MRSAENHSDAKVNEQKESSPNKTEVRKATPVVVARNSQQIEMPLRNSIDRRIAQSLPPARSIATPPQRPTAPVIARSVVENRPASISHRPKLNTEPRTPAAVESFPGVAAKPEMQSQPVSQQDIFRARMKELALRKQQRAALARLNGSTTNEFRFPLNQSAVESKRKINFANVPAYRERYPEASTIETPVQSVPDPDPDFEAEFWELEMSATTSSSNSDKVGLSTLADAISANQLNNDAVRSEPSKRIVQTELAPSRVYANVGGRPSRVSFGNQAIQSEPMVVPQVESEYFEGSQKLSVPKNASPSELWLNERSRYDFSKLKPLQTEVENEEEKSGVAFNFSDTPVPTSDLPESQSNVWTAAENRLDQEVDELTPAGDLPSESRLDETEFEGSSDEEEAEQSIEAQREAYRGDLHQPISLVPALRALTYIDDDENTHIPRTDQQRLYLVGFNEFYGNPVSAGGVRSDLGGVLASSKCALWKSPDLCYQPLYFEDANLERFGARFGLIQPAVSGLHFFASTIRLPYRMALDPYCQCKFSAGFGRPGNRYCYQRERLPWNLKAGSFQALLITGLVFAVP